MAARSTALILLTFDPQAPNVSCHPAHRSPQDERLTQICLRSSPSPRRPSSNATPLPAASPPPVRRSPHASELRRAHASTDLTLRLPAGARFPCSSPSCIPCPPLVKWLGRYRAGREPSCRTASLRVSPSIARAGRSVALQCVQACFCEWADEFSAPHQPVVQLWHIYGCFLKPWQHKINITEEPEPVE